MATQKELIQDIHVRSIRMEEHLKTMNGSIKKHEDKIIANEKSIINLDKEQEKITTWYRIKSTALVVVSGILGSVATWLFLLLKPF